MIFRGILRSDRPFSDPGEARTLDPLIKSQLLYQLSYGVLRLCFSQLRCKGRLIFFLMQIFLPTFFIGDVNFSIFWIYTCLNSLFQTLTFRHFYHRFCFSLLSSVLPTNLWANWCNDSVSSRIELVATEPGEDVAIERFTDF